MNEDGKESELMIEDWEVGALYWNCLRRAEGYEIVAKEKVKQKYFTEFVSKTDLYFFMGTTKQFHNVGESPFIIIGTFHPLLPKREQGNTAQSNQLSILGF